LSPPQLLSHACYGGLHLSHEDLLTFFRGRRAWFGVRRDGEVARGEAVKGRPVDDPVLGVPERDPRGRELVETNVLSGNRHHDRRLLVGCMPGVRLGGGGGTQTIKLTTVVWSRRVSSRAMRSRVRM